MILNQIEASPTTLFLKKDNKPFLIAGPCSAETEEQVMETARGLVEADVDLFRAGIWKPRTRPGVFEGRGSIALPWLKRVKEETGMRTTVEVANAKQVDKALTYGVDVLWIGARSTANPFSVQEIADALKGVDIPVMVKNPTNPDLEFLQHLDVIRHQIDDLDFEVLNLLAKRMKLSEEIGLHKKQSKVSVFQVARWNEILEKAKVMGRERGLSEGFISNYLSAVHQESIKRQAEAKNESLGD